MAEAKGPDSFQQLLPVVQCELEVPHPPHYEQLPSCLLARTGWGTEGKGGKGGGSAILEASCILRM